MSAKYEDQAIALAGIFQAAALVDQIARKGMVPQNNLEASLNSIFVTSPPNTADVFGGQRDLPYNLNMGLRMLADIVDKKDQEKDITRYALSLLHIEGKLRKNGHMLGKISSGLDRIKDQARYFEETERVGNGDAEQKESAAEAANLIDERFTPGDSRYCHTNVVSSLASLYQDTISTFSFRIQVTGEPRYLQNQENANKIRALLLAGIRSAILWDQIGGKRWHLLFFRKQIGKAAKELLNRSYH